MATPRDVLRSALVWGGIAGVTLVAVPPMLLGYPLVLVDPNRELSDRYMSLLGRTLVGLNPEWSVRVEGRHHLERGGPFVLVVNHQSLVDLIAMCFLRHPTKYLGKQAVFDVPVFGWAMRIAGYVGVERGDRASGARALARLGDWLRRGVSVGIFPEGTRSRKGSLGAFKPGAFKLAIEHGRPIVPVVLSGAADVLPKGSMVFEGRADVRVTVLEPVPTVGLGPEDTTRLAEDVRARMLAALLAAEAAPAES